ncbi:MAG: hypothetical protein JJT95_04635 [Pararhodobacter sp.]|nr:hypothetical protein [Pararhodobacter sp.]
MIESSLPAGTRTLSRPACAEAGAAPAALSEAKAGASPTGSGALVASGRPLAASAPAISRAGAGRARPQRCDLEIGIIGEDEGRFQFLQFSRRFERNVPAQVTKARLNLFKCGHIGRIDADLGLAQRCDLLRQQIGPHTVAQCLGRRAKADMPSCMRCGTSRGKCRRLPRRARALPGVFPRAGKFGQARQQRLRRLALLQRLRLGAVAAAFQQCHHVIARAKRQVDQFAPHAQAPLADPIESLFEMMGEARQHDKAEHRTRALDRVQRPENRIHPCRAGTGFEIEQKALERFQHLARFRDETGNGRVWLAHVIPSSASQLARDR